MNIYYFSKEEEEREYVKSKLAGHTLQIFDGTIQEHGEIDGNGVEILSIFVKSQIGKEELDRFPDLKFISTRSTGFDHVDIEEAKKRGIVVSNVPAYGQNTVAEFAMALLLALSRKVYDAYSRVERSGSFSQVGLRGFDIKGKTVGVIGGGRIGKCFIKMVRSFDTEVLVYDVNQSSELATELGFSYVTLDGLLKRSDIVSVHAPYNENTKSLLNWDNMKTMKRGSYLINTARGGIVDTSAIVHALEEGILAGAGLDVLEEEGTMMNDETELLYSDHPEKKKLQTVLSNHYLIDHPRVIVTPHIAFNTGEAIQRIIDTTLENIESFSSGEAINVVT